MPTYTYRILRYSSDAPNVPEFVSITAEELGTVDAAFKPDTLSQVLTASGIVPIADGTKVTGVGVTDNGSVTTQSGIVIAAEQAT